MDQNNIVAVPEEGNADYAQKLVKAGLTAIPLVGGLMGELVDMCIQPRYQKKMEEWCHYVNNMIQDLINGGISKEQIFESEEFISVFMKSSRLYMENIETYKKPLLQQALKSSVISDIPLDKKYIFLEIIGELTETQLLILKDVADNEQLYERGTQLLYERGTQLYKDALEKQLAGRYAGGDDGYLKLLISGLENKHLIGYGVTDPKVIQDGRVQWHMVPSNIGREFIDYLKM